jgi:outer membrane protein OmpA-like peptidoglycan-associated protein
LPGARKRLDEVASVLVAQEQIAVVEGHTDAKGSPWKNVDLSRRRAEAVRRYLVSRGCATDRLVARGMGPDRPVADNATVEGRANNRRIEIVINRP